MNSYGLCAHGSLAEKWMGIEQSNSMTVAVVKKVTKLFIDHHRWLIANVLVSQKQAAIHLTIHPVLSQI